GVAAGGFGGWTASALATARSAALSESSSDTRSTAPNDWSRPWRGLPLGSRLAARTVGLSGAITGTELTRTWVLTRGRDDAKWRPPGDGLAGGMGLPTTSASGGAGGAIVGEVFSPPHRTTLVAGGSRTVPAPGRTSASTMVIISPLSMACTWQTL